MTKSDSHFLWQSSSSSTKNEHVLTAVVHDSIITDCKIKTHFGHFQCLKDSSVVKKLDYAMKEFFFTFFENEFKLGLEFASEAAVNEAVCTYNSLLSNDLSNQLDTFQYLSEATAGFNASYDNMYSKLSDDISSIIKGAVKKIDCDDHSGLSAFFEKKLKDVDVNEFDQVLPIFDKYTVLPVPEFVEYIYQPGPENAWDNYFSTCIDEYAWAVSACTVLDLNVFNSDRLEVDNTLRDQILMDEIDNVGFHELSSKDVSLSKLKAMKMYNAFSTGYSNIQPAYYSEIFKEFFEHLFSNISFPQAFLSKFDFNKVYSMAEKYFKNEFLFSYMLLVFGILIDNINIQYLVNYNSRIMSNYLNVEDAIKCIERISSWRSEHTIGKEKSDILNLAFRTDQNDVKLYSSAATGNYIDFKIVDYLTTAQYDMIANYFSSYHCAEFTTPLKLLYDVPITYDYRKYALTCSIDISSRVHEFDEYTESCINTYDLSEHIKILDENNQITGYFAKETQNNFDTYIGKVEEELDSYSKSFYLNKETPLLKQALQTLTAGVDSYLLSMSEELTNYIQKKQSAIIISKDQSWHEAFEASVQLCIQQPLSDALSKYDYECTADPKCTVPELDDLVESLASEIVNTIDYKAEADLEEDIQKSYQDLGVQGREDCRQKATQKWFSDHFEQYIESKPEIWDKRVFQDSFDMFHGYLGGKSIYLKAKGIRGTGNTCNVYGTVFVYAINEHAFPNAWWLDSAMGTNKYTIDRLKHIIDHIYLKTDIMVDYKYRENLNRQECIDFLKEASKHKNVILMIFSHGHTPSTNTGSGEAFITSDFQKSTTTGMIFDSELHDIFRYTPNVFLIAGPCFSGGLYNSKNEYGQLEITTDTLQNTATQEAKNFILCAADSPSSASVGINFEPITQHGDIFSLFVYKKSLTYNEIIERHNQFFKQCQRDILNIYRKYFVYFQTCALRKDKVISKTLQEIFLYDSSIYENDLKTLKMDKVYDLMTGLSVEFSFQNGIKHNKQGYISGVDNVLGSSLSLMQRAIENVYNKNPYAYERILDNIRDIHKVDDDEINYLYEITKHVWLFDKYSEIEKEFDHSLSILEINDIISKTMIIFYDEWLRLIDRSELREKTVKIVIEIMLTIIKDFICICYKEEHSKITKPIIKNDEFLISLGYSTERTYISLIKQVIISILHDDPQIQQCRGHCKFKEAPIFKFVV